MEILAFCSGILFFYSQSLVLVAGLLIALFLKAPRHILLWFLGAVFWACAHQWFIAEQGMPNTLVIPKAHLVGEIISIPIAADVKSSFQFSILRLDNKPVKAWALLTCYTHCPVFKVGESWEFEAKLKKPLNSQNPGHFDYAEKLSAQHITWTGYLKDGTSRRIPSQDHGFWLQQLRVSLADKISKAMSYADGIGVIQAITLGVTNQITKAQWDLFRRTGTTHLMVISGSHIGLVAGLVYLGFEWLWRRSSRLCLYCPSQQSASIVAFLVGLLYALLAGFGFPVERALIASALFFSRNIVSRRFTAWQALRYGLFIVVLAEPHAVLSPGFYLSFTVVAILISCSQRIVHQGIKKMLLLQLACFFGLMPMTLYWFSYSATNGFFANIVAIPFVEYLIVPLSLLSVLLIQYLNFSYLFIPLDYLTQCLLVFLTFIDTTAWINFDYPLLQALFMVALLLVLGLLVFLPIKTLWLPIIIILISVLTPKFDRPQLGEARVAVLDVGQGLAVLINTANHTLLYDTGVKFYNGGDMGALAILPYFRQLGIKMLDKVVISHPDLDHRGGLPSIEKSIPIQELIVNDPSFYHRGLNCHQFPDWEWDGVLFHFFAIKEPLAKKNNTCCVLQVKTKGGSVLLPGDIEKQAENYLVKKNAEHLKSTVLIVAHHGSKTSSSLQFIQQIAPKYAIISAGFDNRYHFPHQDIVRRFSAEHITLLNTIDCGMVSFTLPNAQATALKPSCYSARNPTFFDLFKASLFFNLKINR